MRLILLLSVIFLISFSPLFAAGNVPSLLDRAEELKYAEKYEAAEKLYDEILKIDPDNQQALQGKDDCRLMLAPIIPVQHLVPSVIDPEYQQLAQRRDDAKTPWEKRRAEMAIERYSLKYNGTVYGRDTEKYGKKAEKIIAAALEQLDKGGSAELIYRKTRLKLAQLQESADRSWKGHGPQILETSLERLDDLYLERKYRIPDIPVKSYKLVAQLEKRDIDPEMIKNIDSVPPPYPPGSQYQLGDLKYKAGKYKIIKFIAEYQGASKFSKRSAPFHDLLVLKIDNANTILDGFHYTLEWTDAPSLDLYRMKKKGAKLLPGLDLQALELRNSVSGQRLKEYGKIIL